MAAERCAKGFWCKPGRTTSGRTSGNKVPKVWACDWSWCSWRGLAWNQFNFILVWTWIYFCSLGVNWESLFPTQQFLCFVSLLFPGHCEGYAQCPCFVYAKVDGVHSCNGWWCGAHTDWCKQCLVEQWFEGSNHGSPKGQTILMVSKVVSTVTMSKDSMMAIGVGIKNGLPAAAFSV